MNMKHFLCLLFCLSFLLFPVYAQESYETYSGDTFKTGDVLTLVQWKGFAFLQGNNP